MSIWTDAEVDAYLSAKFAVYTPGPRERLRAHDDLNAAEPIIRARIVPEGCRVVRVPDRVTVREAALGGGPDATVGQVTDAVMALFRDIEAQS